MWGAIVWRSTFSPKIMVYSIKVFKPEIEKSDPLQTHCFTQVLNSESILFAKGIQTTYLPNVWSALLCEAFKANPSHFIKESWTNLSFLREASSRFNQKAEVFKSKLTSEQLYILDNQYAKNPKAGTSLISIKLERKKIKYNILGDNFLFIYNEKMKKLYVYCSMIDGNGKLDLSQPCHCIYNDLTLIGTPIIDERALKDSICFIMSRDMANWFINNFKTDQSQAITALLSLSNNDDYNKLLRKIQSQQSYNQIPFDKNTASLVIIQHEQDAFNFATKLKAYLNWIKKRKFIWFSLVLTLALVLLILCIWHASNNSKEQASSDMRQENIIQPECGKKIATEPERFIFYHTLLNKEELSFCEIQNMMKQSVKDSLIKNHKELYDTLCAYSAFVDLYQFDNGKQPCLKKALSTIFANVNNGKFKIIDKYGSIILSTNLTSGKITCFRDFHKKILIEMFIGKYNDDGTIKEYDDATKKENYCKAIDCSSAWKSFIDMK